MGKCLVTKLNGAVANPSLLHIGEMRINIPYVNSPSKSTQEIELAFSKASDIKIIGDGHFTDETLSQNLGKVNGQVTNEKVYVSNSDCELSISNKYNITTLASNHEFDIENLKYSAGLYKLSSAMGVGDISSLANKPSLAYLYLGSPLLTGDLSALKDAALTYVNFSSAKITGDLSNFKDKPLLTRLYLNSPFVTGDFSAFANCPSLVHLQINCSQVGGDISSFANTKVREVRLSQNGKQQIAGDIAKLPNDCYYLSFDNGSNTSLTWTSRDTAKTIIGIYGSPKVANVDDMLIGMAKCTVSSYITPSSSSYLKTIAVTGTRTSASDAAVATLQQKGYTVSVTPA